MAPQQLNLLATVSITACWGAFVLTWLGAAIYYNSNGPTAQTRTLLGSTALPGTFIVILGNAVVPKTAWRSLVLDVSWPRLLGLAILLAATGLTVWARLTLGAMWSGAPAVKQAHELRTTGPYALTRHPIYTGILAMLLGTSLLAGAGRWILPFPVFLILILIKLHVEEGLMQAEFPADYPRYRQRVPQLVPGLRLLGRRQSPGG